MYQKYKKMFSGHRYPLAFVDLDRFDQNVAYVASTQEGTGKTIRVASKSIRCLELIKRVFEIGRGAYRGILAFTMEEAAYLLDNGLDDIIVAYPSTQATDVSLFVEKTRQGAGITMMIDCLEHMEALSRAGQEAGLELRVCMDVDMSFRPFGRRGHIGVRRSPVRSAGQAAALARASKDLEGVRINSVMGYEAQIASVNDDIPGKPLKNALLKLVKGRSVSELTRRRGEIVHRLRAEGLDIHVVNGGGSGSLVSTARDEVVTEVTAGSAFFAPALFHHFHEVRFTPSAFFGLQIVRIPEPGIVTCQGGGYTASGEAGIARLPLPVMPDGLAYFSMEGAGEVQTPLRLPKGCPPMRIGDPVFFQHAKAGELCERFNSLYLVQGDEVTGSVNTYRGDGYAFL